VTVPILKPDLYEDETRPVFIEALNSGDGSRLFDFFVERIKNWDYNSLRWSISRAGLRARSQTKYLTPVIEALTKVLDRHFPLGDKKRSALVRVVMDELNLIFRSLPKVTETDRIGNYALVDFDTRKGLRPPLSVERTLVVDASNFEPEGDLCDSVLLGDAYQLGWRRFMLFDLRGQRFEGCGFGPRTDDVRIDLYGSSGDYVASGIDGMEIHIHGNGQDQLGQIMKRGLLVVHGDVGQCFMYGAKGGTIYVLGNAAGRPLINAAGNPRVVINGTALDFLAESFMAGDPLKGGGFVIVNGLTLSEDGDVSFLERPYPGSNLFSLASGGAIYIRDPHQTLVDEQLNGGRFGELSDADWNLIHPYLMENQKHFGIPVEQLLTVDGVPRAPKDVYRKVEAVPLAVLTQIPETDDSQWQAKAATA
jgi:glutamate synthase domain-containing protein 3